MRGTILPLKYTQQTDVLNPFAQLICKKYGKESFAQVQRTFEEMQMNRNALDFGKMNTQIHNDYRLAAEFETLVTRYLRYVYLADQYFAQDFTSSNRLIQIPYTWTDSF
mmetsp:Transcript_11240/g.9627  ORF Transcript_11240/g.9627 Transcript_11240/m.9627 type:complete len:109 (+) Transcript_11240:137-463(+)